ncbi:hypothetical protein [Saccharococcus thermophilus]|uniref:Uncharacterized protein n=1 Tax=Saccharococcus thermophilus TaxID=29396 RepID=A0A846MIS8_9BACL|nr:hypothetical protein [Saccharococcus thermophilus]NIK15325.1 hypothetical protein [Saccharococcus thermophilus]
MSLNLLNELLQNKEIRKQVLIEFGFGSANPKKVLKFIQEKFPTEYAELSSRETLNNPKVAQFMPKEIELSSRAERDAILDNFERKFNS